MKFEKDFNPGQNNTYQEYNFGPGSQNFPNVTELTINNYGTQEDKVKPAPAKVAPKPPADSFSEPDPNKDLTAAKTAILNYRVTPLLSFDWKHRFMMVWESILDLPEVESRIYDVGRQRYTSFNRTLVASILRFLDKYGAYALAFSGSVMARCLEKDISHPVRAGFRNDPPQDIMASIDMMIRSGGYKHRKP